MERLRRYKGLLFVSIAIAAAALLSTCDNAVNLLDVVSVEVMKGNDRFLKVEYLSPGINAVDCDPNGSILVRFDRAVDLSSVTASTFKILQGTTEIPWVNPPAVENDGKALRFSLVSFFNNNTSYVAKISGLVSTSGDTLLEGYEWSFVTGEAPAGTISITSNNSLALAGYTNAAANTVALTTNGSSSTDAYYVTTTDITEWTTAQFAGISNWTGITDSALLSDYDIGATTGTRSVYVVFRKDGGTGTKYSSVKKATIIYDITPPSVSSFVIRDNDSPNPTTYTNSTDVVLEQSVADAQPIRMQFNNTAWSALESYAATKSWSLIPSDGGKTVQARFYDAAGNTPVSTSSASIMLDTVSPTKAPTLTSPSTPTNDTTPSWTWGAQAGSGGDGLFSYRLGGASFGAPTSMTSYTAPIMPEGGFYFRVREHDKAGNYGSEAVFTITIDTTPPNPPIVDYTLVSPTELSFSWSSGGGGGNGHYDYELNDSTPDLYTNSTSTSYAHPKPLPDATHKFYVKERDAAGNLSAAGVATKSINITGITPDNGATVNVLNSLTLSWPAPGFLESDKFCFSLDASSWNVPFSVQNGTFTETWTAHGNTLLYWKVIRTRKMGTVTYGPYQVIVIKK